MRIAYILLAAFLILYGLNALFDFAVEGLGVILGLLALAAGVFLILGDRSVRRRR